MSPPADITSSGIADAKTSFARIDDFSPQELEDWGRLAAQRTESAPFLDEAWVRSWIAAFAPKDHLCLCVRRGGRLVGMAPMRPAPGGGRRRGLRTLESATNDWSYRYEFLALDDEEEIYRKLWATLFSDDRWDAIRLNWVVEGTPTMRWGLEVAREMGWRSAVVEAPPSPWRRLPRPGEPWDEGLKTKFKAKLRNRERRMEAFGEATFTVCRYPDDVEAAASTFYDIEAKSWKGRAGTAIAMQPAARILFDGLVRASSHDVWIPILSVAGKPIAAQFVRVRDRTMFLLKTAYDPEYAVCSPGQLITARLLRFGMESGMESLDFLGAPMDWKSDWAPENRNNVELVFFSPSLAGRVAYWASYGLKGGIKRVPFAASLARRLRRAKKT